MQKPHKLSTALLFFCAMSQVNAEQFISLNLCSDRLLIDLARSEQIAAMSPYSQNPLMMLDKINTDKPTLEPKLTELLPYLDKTILVNEYFYPQLVESLKRLGAKIMPINDTAQTPEQLFELILQLGKLTGNEEQAEKLVEKLQSQSFRLNSPLAETLILSDTGIVETTLPQYQTLLNLLGLKPLKNSLTQQNFSLEKVLLSQPNVLISLTDKQGYNEQAELLHHPILQKIFANRPLATAPLKYTYCFDHGIWQGAEIIYHQLK
ncbi:ABC transporter substrate-binding protein [Caviibacterium pharyngocola]|uniref:Helical backbone metal receptor n=1 Tax=Caviibacterium pharyngocola TaxID=28159 RepID=A0A2M8RU48_9PAST|nr:ABC transporter substrate-binding protein [Caviibacterium pharyngocola]PJG82407.1 helical backbone metal receptor [Caviibacterium pharyngocola]